MSKVAILGAGPAGLMAAYAAERNGHEPVIFAAALLPSSVNEDMFLQRPLPDLPGHDEADPDAVINYVNWGTPEGYALRCYGSSTAPVSWGSIRWGFGDAWWLKPVYEKLYDRYEGCLVQRTIDYASIEDIRREFPSTLSTLPAPTLCGGGHNFADRPTWLVRQKHTDRYDRNRNRNEMIYNGDRLGFHESWFRASHLHGWTTFEYSMEPPERETGPNPIVVPGLKLLANDCSCNPRVHRVGRWAQWTRGVLNHHTFEQATAILASEGLGKGA